MISHVRSVENTVNDGEVKVEGATPSCCTVESCGGRGEPPSSHVMRANSASQHQEYSNFALPTSSSFSSWHLPIADGPAEFSVVVSGLRV